MARTPTTPKTAPQEYEDAARDIAGQLVLLQRYLAKEHAAYRGKATWGDLSTLQHLRHQLFEVLVSTKPHDDEADALAEVEAELAKARPRHL
jgi:hypothetical protein